MVWFVYWVMNNNIMLILIINTISNLIISHIYNFHVLGIYLLLCQKIILILLVIQHYNSSQTKERNTKWQQSCYYCNRYYYNY